MLGTYINNTFGPRYYGKAINISRRLTAAYDKALENYDLLLMPTTPMKATPLPAPNASREEYVARALEMITNTAPFDITHHPAMSLPCGMVDGLPVGLMLVGRHFDEIDDLSRGACLRADPATGRRCEERRVAAELDQRRMANAFVAAFEILSFGAIIVLVVLGLGIIASMMGIFNFAQGEFVLLGAYITYLAYSHGMPVWVGMVGRAVPGRRARLRAGGADHPALLRRADRGHARHLCARTDHPRERARPDRRSLSLGAGADRRIDRLRQHARLGVALRHHRHHAAGHGRLLSAAVAHQLRPADPRHAGKPGAGAGVGHFDRRDLRRDLCVRRGAGRASPAR